MCQPRIRHTGIVQVQALRRLQLGEGLKPRLAHTRPHKLQHPQGSKTFQTLQPLVGKAAVAERQFDQRGYLPNLDQSVVANIGSSQVQMSELLEVLELRHTLVGDVRMVKR